MSRFSLQLQAAPAEPESANRRKPSIALYQPDIAGNTGTLLRLGACLDLDIEVIEPTGFDLSDRALKRAGMDYVAMSRLIRHVDWQAFEQKRHADGRRLILFTTTASMPYVDAEFQASDILLFGRESAGAPSHVHETADLRVAVPMASGARSLNLAVTAAMAAGEALRQTGTFPVASD